MRTSVRFLFFVGLLIASPVAFSWGRQRQPGQEKPGVQYVGWVPGYCTTTSDIVCYAIMVSTIGSA